MADYKGIIRFIGENSDWALIEERVLTESPTSTSTGIATSTGNGYIRNFSGTLTPVVEESEVIVKIDGTSIDARDYNGIIKGTDISTNAREVSTVDYETGAIDLYLAEAPSEGASVSVQYKYSSSLVEFDGHKLVKGSFSGRSVNEVIYYDYDLANSLKDGYYITIS